MTDPTSLPNFPPPPEDRPLRGRVLDALQDLKLSPDITSGGDVRFMAQDQQLFAKCIQNGQVEVLRIYGQWQISDTVPDDMATRLNACNDITLGVHLVKAGIASGNLVLAVEQLVGGRENPKGKVQVAVGLLLQGVSLWHKNAVAKSQRYEAIARGEDPDAAAQAAAAQAQADEANHQDDGQSDQEGQEGEKKQPQAAGPWLSEGPARSAGTRGDDGADGDTDTSGSGSGDDSQSGGSPA